ncbi:MAG: hypothetical protein Q4A28_00720 [Brachymonas sp.]|nr:hypothetical protein [Brachymonas sp.]
MSFLITAHARAHLPQSDLARAVLQRSGQPLRRASPLASLALLACLDVLAHEQAVTDAAACETVRAVSSNTGPTALIWHSQQGPQPETESLLAAQRTGDGLLLPFDFLASQPALLGVQLKPWLPGLAQTLFLPGTAHPQAQVWMHLLQLAHFGLVQKRFGRVICASLERDSGICRYAAISLATDSLTGVSAQATKMAQGQAAPAHGAGHCLLRGRWQAQPSGNGPLGDTASEAVATGGLAQQADAALWRCLETEHAASDAEPALLLPAKGACLHLHRLRV